MWIRATPACFLSLLFWYCTDKLVRAEGKRNLYAIKRALKRENLRLNSGEEKNKSYSSRTWNQQRREEMLWNGRINLTSASVCFLFSANDKVSPGKLKMFYDCRHGKDSIIRVTAKWSGVYVKLKGSSELQSAKLGMKNMSGWWNAQRGLFCIKAQWLVPGSDIMRFGGGSCAATIVFVITQPHPVNKWQPQFTGRWRPQHVDSALELNLTLNLCTSSAQHPHYASWVTDLRLLVGSPRTWNNTKVIGGGGRIGNGWRQCDSFQKDFTERRGKKNNICVEFIE